MEAKGARCWLDEVQTNISAALLGTMDVATRVHKLQDQDWHLMAGAGAQPEMY